MVRELAYEAARKHPDLARGAMWALTQAWLTIPRAFRPHAIPGRGLMSACDYRAAASCELINGCAAIVPVNDDGGNRMYWAGVYEAETVRLFASLCLPGATVIDVGASIGQYTLTAADRVGANGQVHAFECDTVTFKWLRRNVSLNSLRTRAHTKLNEVALSDANGTAALHLAETRDTGSNSLVGAPWVDSGRTAIVRTMTLDSYLATHMIAKVDVMKVDVEGAELAVFKGAEALLTGANPPTLIVEFEPERQRLAGGSCVELAGYLTERGYALRTIGVELTAFDPAKADAGGAANKGLSYNVLATPRG